MFKYIKIKKIFASFILGLLVLIATPFSNFVNPTALAKTNNNQSKTPFWITEIAYQGSPTTKQNCKKYPTAKVTCASDKWIEIYNPSDSIQSLAGWKLKIGRKSDSGDFVFTRNLPDVDLQPKQTLILKNKNSSLVSSLNSLEENTTVLEIGSLFVISGNSEGDKYVQIALLSPNGGIVQNISSHQIEILENQNPSDLTRTLEISPTNQISFSTTNFLPNFLASPGQILWPKEIYSEPKPVQNKNLAPNPEPARVVEVQTSPQTEIQTTNEQAQPTQALQEAKTFPNLQDSTDKIYNTRPVFEFNPNLLISPNLKPSQILDNLNLQNLQTAQQTTKLRSYKVYYYLDTTQEIQTIPVPKFESYHLLNLSFLGISYLLVEILKSLQRASAKLQTSLNLTDSPNLFSIR